MFESIKQIWRSLKRFFRRLFSGSSSSNLRKNKNTDIALPPLTDTDYEFLFSQLLEGVSRGWHQGRVLKFFEQLENRTKQRDWLEWLDRFGQRVLDSSAPNHQLAARMMRLGELAQSIPRLTKIGDLCYGIGRQIFTRNSEGEGWEYQGTEIDEALQTEPNFANNNQEPLTIEQVFGLLQENTEFAQEVSAQLGIDTLEPQKILDVWLEKSQETQDEQNTGNIEYWFNLGLEQVNQGQLEEAIASWDQVLSLNPQLPKAWYNRANALTNLYRWDEALASYDQAINLNPQDHLAWNGLANVFYSTNRIQESFDCWDKVVQIQPAHSQAWYDRGYVLEMLNRPAEAITSYHKAIELKPGFPEVLARLKELQSEPENLN